MVRTDVREAYTGRAEEYTSKLGSMDAMHEPDRRLISRWADEVPGRIVDAGCGPGHWTDYLRGRGCEIEGVDLVPAFVDGARSRFPDTRYRIGRLDALEVPDDSVAGIMAWYSIIHTVPDDVPGMLAEFARCLSDDGRLLLGMFEGPRVEAFPHAVTTAYFWSVAEMSLRLMDAGFRVEATESRVEPGSRPHAAILARRADRPRPTL